MRIVNCRRPGCERPIEASMLACQRHWMMLPPELRTRITRLWRNVLHARAERHPDTRSIAARYIAAVEEADAIWA